MDKSLHRKSKNIFYFQILGCHKNASPSIKLRIPSPAEGRGGWPVEVKVGAEVPTAAETAREGAPIAQKSGTTTRVKRRCSSPGSVGSGSTRRRRSAGSRSPRRRGPT